MYPLRCCDLAYRKEDILNITLAENRNYSFEESLHGKATIAVSIPNKTFKSNYKRRKKVLFSYW